MTTESLPQPPYPADTRAKGWRFELDYERIDQSDTWSLAGEVPMAQHALIFMWLVAWKEVPCGSFPNDEAVIRAKCRIPPAVWAKTRAVCMRGWEPASDGRLYHPTITARVLEMLDYRAKNAKRVADFKERMREQQAANALATGESPAKNDTGTGTGTSLQDKPVEKKRRGKRAPGPVPESVSADVLIAAGFDGETAAEFIATKAQRDAPLTPRAWADHCREAAKAGWTPLQAAEKLLAKTWKGFEAKYVADEKPGRPVESFAQRAARERVEATVPGIAARPSIFTEIFDVTARRLG